MRFAFFFTAVWRYGRQRQLPLLLAGLLALLPLPASQAAAATIALRLQTAPAELRLEPFVSYFCDGSGLLDLPALKNRLRPLARNTITLGYQDGNCWFHFRLENAGQHALALLLQINYPGLDNIEFFAPGAPAQAHLLLGDQRPFAERPLLLRPYVIPLSLKPGQSQDYYLRVQSNTSMNVPLSLSGEKAYLETMEWQSWIRGGSFGITLGLIIYHLFLWVAVREKIYRFYLLFLGSGFFYLLCIEGIGYRLWPQFPVWNSYAQLVFIFLMMAASLLFARDYLDTRRSLLQDRFLLIQAGICMATALLLGFIPLSLSHKLQAILGACSVISIALVSSLRLYQGWREARLFLLAFGVLLLMALLLAIQSFGLIPGLPFLLAMNGMIIAFLLQQTLLAFALADRVNILKTAHTQQIQAVARAEAESAAKTEFLAKMSHEIRTPMNAMLGITQLLQDTSLDRVQKNYVETLLSSGHALLNVINDILDYSKIAAGKIELEMVDFNLLDLLDECIQVFTLSAREKSLALICERSRDLPIYVRGDAGRLRQVLLNLLSNAIKFTDYGTVFLRASVLAAEGPHLRLQFEVEDSGIGMQADMLPRLFESFEQADSSTSRQYGGSGLGLAISRQLVELMQGEIGVSSSPGQGSTFRFSALLQAAAEPAVLPDARQLLITPSLFAGRSALVVEDNPINQLVIHGFLRKVGIEARMASSGQEALDILAAQTQDFDLIFMDCEMPFMDGFETTRRLRLWERQQDMKPHCIVALTAHALPEHRERCLAAGMNDYLSKPLLLSKLVEKLQALFKPEASACEKTA